MSRIDEITESIETLIDYIQKGSKVIWYYKDKNGVFKYDVYLSSDGKKTNKDGRPIQCLHGKSENILIELQNKLDELIETERIVQGKLF